MSAFGGVALFGPPRCVACRKREDWLCASCRAEARPPREAMAIEDVTQAVSPWAYEGGPRSLVLALKLRGCRSAAAPLIGAMTQCARRARLDPELVTWVPARDRDKAVRGFDHAEVLAQGVAEGLGVPAAPLLARCGVQVDQAGLDRQRRWANLSGAFRARSRTTHSVLLVDDLVTTGATASSCAAVLKAAGASCVDLAVACRR